MDHAKRTKPQNLRKLDSAVLLERTDSPTGAYAFVRQAPGYVSPSDVEHGAAREAPVGIDLTIRFGRVFVLMVLSVAVLVAVSLFFNRGFELGHYNPNDYDTDGQKQLVDDYNSYTGTVASAFSHPIEGFITIAVQLVLLRVMASSLLSPEVGWKASAFTTVATTAVSFLIMNSINALNVQPLEPEVKAYISAVDLTYVPDFSNSDAALRTTNVSQTFSERSPKNPLANTALRNLVLPRVPMAESICTPINRFDVSNALPDIVQEFGFSQRDWQNRLLQEAIEPQTLRVVVNPSDKTAKQSFNLPMDAAVGADLFMYSMLVAPYFLSWTSWSQFVDQFNMTGKIESVARATKLLPPLTSAQDETAQREWFIRESAKALSQKLATAKNVVRSDVAMEFSHVDISKSVHFDAVTIDFQVDPTSVGEKFANGNSTWTNNLYSNLQCGPWPLRCAMPNPIRKKLTDMTDETYDVPAQVQVFGVCVNDDGKEELTFLDKYTDSFGVSQFFHCPQTSNKSLMVVSIGKRFVADSVTQSGSVVTKMRRIYSLTMGKLSWESSDLVTDFGATCLVGEGACKGLRFPLDPTSANPKLQQELIVGIDALPTKRLKPMVVIPNFRTTWRFTPLVVLQEPTPRYTEAGGADYRALSIDPLLPHNVAKVSWNLQAPPSSSCDPLIENTIQLVLDNHLYIEHGLQTAYTAATFYLLQSAVVKEVISLRDNKTSLNFQQNELRVALWASIPDLNVWLTIGGCGLLIVSLLVVMLWACATSKNTTGSRVGGLGEVTTPQVVARIMLDEQNFPPAYLHRRVIGSEGPGEQKPASIKGYVIDGLALQPPPRDPKV